MILLWGPATDPPLAAVHAALVRRAAPVLIVDTNVAACSMQLTVDPYVRGTLRVGNAAVDLVTVAGMYLRPTVPSAGPDGAALHDALWAFSEVTPAVVLNRPAAMAGNSSKPFQATQVRAVGFQSPDTLVTTSADAARAFAVEHGAVIYKSNSGVRSVVAMFDAGDEQRLADLSSCPTQLQQRIVGTDVRVHVVGPLSFACEIRSPAIDYRYAGRDGHKTELRSTRLPPEIELRCHALAALTELPLAGIDLRRTPDGAWYCFEINPSPGFTYYADATDQPVADAIAELLTADLTF